MTNGRSTRIMPESRPAELLSILAQHMKRETRRDRTPRFRRMSNALLLNINSQAPRLLQGNPKDMADPTMREHHISFHGSVITIFPMQRHLPPIPTTQPLPRPDKLSSGRPRVQKPRFLFSVFGLPEQDGKILEQLADAALLRSREVRAVTQVAVHTLDGNLNI